jgi:hypothetical protein
MLKDKLIKLIIAHDQKHCRERGTGFYTETLAEELIQLLGGIDGVCDCSCCRSVDTLRDNFY